MTRTRTPETIGLPGTDRSKRRTPNLAHALARTAVREPDVAAVVQGELRWTWAELDARVDALAAGLETQGIRPGSVVLTHAPNCVDLITVMYAVWRVGAVWAPTNFRIDPADIAVLAAHTEPDLFICHEDYQRHATAVGPVPTWVLIDGAPAEKKRPAGGAPFGDRFVHDVILTHVDSVPLGYAPRADDPVWYFFTSGSSGPPKVAVLTHDQMQFVVTSHLCDLMPDLRSTDGTLVVAPLSHGAGIHVTMHVARGARIVLLPDRSLDPPAAWSLVESEQISTIFTVPTILARLTQHDAVAHYDRSSLRYVIYAGAPITAKDLRKAFDALGPVLVQYYGLGEVTGNVTVLPPWLHEETLNGDGAPPAGLERTGMQISIQDNEGLELTPGQRGEICVCGPAVFAGYLDNPAANSEAFRDGWFRTGDLGYLDATGMLYITGRDSDMYISGGSNIDPREVEEKILRHPDIAQAGVVGAPDDRWGEVGYAVCVLRDGTDLDPLQLQQWCRANMPTYKAPKKVVLVDSLPTSGYGKVTKNLLRDLLINAGEWPESPATT